MLILCGGRSADDVNLITPHGRSADISPPFGISAASLVMRHAMTAATLVCSLNYSVYISIDDSIVQRFLDYTAKD